MRPLDASPRSWTGWRPCRGGMAEVPRDTRLWRAASDRRPRVVGPRPAGAQGPPGPGALAPQRVDQLAAAIPVAEWQPYLIKRVAKGPGWPSSPAAAAWRYAGVARPRRVARLSAGPGGTPGTQVISATPQRRRLSRPWSASPGCSGRWKQPLRRVKGAWAWTTTRFVAGWAGIIISPCVSWPIIFWCVPASA